jgi:nuclease-like protein
MEKKSPIKDKPLRYAGQSLDEQIHKLVNEGALPYILGTFFIFCFAGYEWLRYFTNLQPSPFTVSFVAIVLAIFSAIKVRTIFRKVKAYKLGREGERVVGQYLESVRENGNRIFHDLIGDNFNIDHVIISTKGIFVIETKTYSKPAKGFSKIRFDGETLNIQGLGLQTEPIIQVKAAASWIKKILIETTGKEFQIKPVILFPGWYVESPTQANKSGIWVLNPKALPKFIEKRRDSISYNDMMMVSYHLSRFIRISEANR